MIFAEIWREYVGYGLNLNLPSIVPSPDLVTNGNDYMELIDSNLATCVQPNMTSCSMKMKVSFSNVSTFYLNIFIILVIRKN